jgi:hypothetical protein
MIMKKEEMPILVRTKTGSLRNAGNGGRKGDIFQPWSIGKHGEARYIDGVIGTSAPSSTYRYANTEEIQAFHQGCRNIENLKDYKGVGEYAIY